MKIVTQKMLAGQGLDGFFLENSHYSDVASYVFPISLHGWGLSNLRLYYSSARIASAARSAA